ncbi:MAG: phosphatidylglycerophosphatase A [Candidatus Solibacter usitatus]|nr:phosphatidylglycerophosphatase A [Candidatus Solibacter usitatus]
MGSRPFAASPSLNTLARLIDTWFGCGYFPFAPGTVGSLAALAIAVPLIARPLHFALLSLAALGPAIWAAGVTAKERGLKDPGLVVVDEVIGQWITLIGATAYNWKSWLLALVLFRLFDIWKPFPVRQLERLPSGTGIVADDVMAGVYGAVVLFALGCFNLY